MGMFSSLFGDGGAAERAAGVAAAGAKEARDQLRKDTEGYQAYYTPYQTAGSAAVGGQGALLGGINDRISGLDPKIAALYQQQAALQPQVNEMYGLSKQQDPILQDILSGGQGFTADPGYQFRLEAGQKALERTRAAGGTLNSGETGKALMEYGQGMGSQEFGNYMGRQYNALNAVNTQLGGRQTALGAGQGQVAGGLNLLGADMNQITQQQQLAQQYQALINSGMSAADASAKLGLDSSKAQAGYTQSAANATASGMQATANSLASAGNNWLNMGSAAIGAFAGMPPGMAPQFSGGTTNQSFGGYGSQAPQQSSGGGQGQSFLGGLMQGFQSYGQPQVGTNMPSYMTPQTGYLAPAWKDPDAGRAAQLGSQSSFVPRQSTMLGA